MAAEPIEKIEIVASDASAIQFHRSASGITIVVMSPGPWAGGKPQMVIRGTATLPTAAVAALKALFNKTRS